MRRHAKAASSGSTTRIALVGFVCLIAFVAAAASASAATVTQRPLLFSFNGADTTGGTFRSVRSIAVDNSGGAVYVGEGFPPSFNQPPNVDRFHPDGTAWAYSATGSSSFAKQFSGGTFGYTALNVAVDNTSAASQGQLFLSTQEGYAEALDPSGNLLWGFQGRNGTFSLGAVDVAVDHSGHRWIADASSFRQAIEYDNTGSPPAKIATTTLPSSPQALDFDASGNMYVVLGERLEKWTGGVFSSVVDPHARSVYVDQSSPTGHIFTVGRANEVQEVKVSATAGQYRLSLGGSQTADLAFNASATQVAAALEALPSVGSDNVFVQEIGSHQFKITFSGLLGEANVEELTCENGTTPLSGGTGCAVSTLTQGEASNVQEYDSSGALLGTYGEGVLGNAISVAYNPTLNRVYVLQEGAHPSVEAFGPSVTGTAPDATIEAPSAVGVSSAHFSGKVNPQGTSSEWRFQWRKQGQSWSEAAASPLQSLPIDSSEHTVEYTTNALRGKTTYQVRLIAINTANQLVGASAAKTFTTTSASQAPAVTIATPNAITAHTAKITGTVNPQGDTADWRVQTSTDPACATGFTNQALQEVTPASASPVAVEYELTGLLGTEHYCARIVATNSAGSMTSETKQFETLDALPTQVFTAYASWRTDTTARLNGYVNPEGSQLTYRFEYSPDGSNWTTLPDQTSSRRSREQIVLGEEVTGLQPNTTYQYRFVVENGGGLEEGEAKEFSTRTSAEEQAPQRGIELVNQPDKGNQNIASRPGEDTTPILTPDGNRILWQLLSGAPGGNSGTYVNFISDRTSNGWTSRSVIPPADEQLGGGSFAYVLSTATPDLRHFVMHAQQTEALQFGPPTLVRLDDNRHQEALKTLATGPVSNQGPFTVHVTDDGTHVLWANYETKELEELTDGASEVVSIMPDGQPNECGVTVADFGEDQEKAGYHPIATTDASRVYFQAVPNGQACNQPRGIFYRDREAGETIEVDPGSSAPHSEIIRATPDGKSLYFVSSVSHVTEDTNNAGDIYRWDAEGGQYTCLTCVVAAPGLRLSPEGKFESILVSDDFSHIYFVGTNQLVAGHGKAGDANLYVLRNGEVGFVANLLSGVGTIQAVRAGELSTNGNVLVWHQSNGRAQLTSDETAAQCHSLGEASLASCREAFRYEDSAESLECLTCAPKGTTEWSAGGQAGASRTSVAAPSADGSTAGFVTVEPLVPEDINNAPDVYEWRGGTVRLVTDGETSFISKALFAAPRVYAVDATGQNIFFTLADKGLTGYEQDGLANLYDARVGGGFPRPQEAEHCSEESCQGPLQAPPGQAAMGSAGLAGAGNVKSAPKGRCAAKRGKARSRCLHPRKHKHKRHAAHRAAKRNSGGSK